MYHKTIYKKDYSPITYSVFITFVVMIIVLLCGILADGVSTPIMAACGATSQDIQESSNITFFSQHIFALTVISPMVLFCVSYVLWRYLQDGLIEYGLFELPYVEDYDAMQEINSYERRKLRDSL